MKKINQLLTVLGLFLSISLNAQYHVNITSPSNIAGSYFMARAAFAANWKDTIKGTIALANNGAGSTIACDTITGVSGKIALIDRGTCAFVDKALRAQKAGAIAVIIANNATTGAFPFGPNDNSVTIPVCMISKEDMDKIRGSVNGATASIYFSNPATQATVLWSEDFKNRLAGWTTKGKLNAVDTFGWDVRGMSNGIARAEIQSPTCFNGAAIFDADFKTTGGTTVPTQPYPRHYGELISPTINCSTFKNVRLSFFQHFSPLNSGYATLQSSLVAFSYDGGATFPDSVEVNADVQPNDETTPANIAIVDIPKFDGNANCKIKFIFNGDFYDWIIDDIQLISRAAVDLKVTDNFFFPFNYATPASQITTDTSTFYVEVTNLGSLSVGNSKARVMITNPAGAVIHRDSVTITNLSGSNKDSSIVNFPKIFVPGKLTQGFYNLTYSIEGPPGTSDGNTTDNKVTKVFAVTNDLYSRHDGNTNNIGYGSTSNFQVANLYFTSTDWNANDKFKATDVGFGAFVTQSSGASLAGKSATFYLARFTDKVASDYNNWDITKGINNNKDQLEIKGLATYDYKSTTNSERATVTLQDFTTFVDGVSLQKGSRYLLAASYADASNALVPYFEPDYLYDFGSFYYNRNGSGQWQLWPFAPELSLRVVLSTPNDDIALPSSTLKLSPNPATTVLKATVKFDKLTNANFTMADIQGRLISFESRKNIKDETIDFDVNRLAPGAYLLRLSTEEGTRTLKFIKQ